MNVLINLSNYLFSEALKELLIKELDGDNKIVARDSLEGFKPTIILTDLNNINQKLFCRYPEAKVILLDTGLEQEDIVTVLLSYKMHGVLSVLADIHLLRKALKVVSEGEIWIDNGTIKAFLHNAGLLSKTGKINGITEKEKEIIRYVSRGYRNKEIASKLSVSEQTVKVHLSRLFRKLNVSSRSQLIALTMNNKVTYASV